MTVLYRVKRPHHEPSTIAQVDGKLLLLSDFRWEQFVQSTPPERRDYLHRLIGSGWTLTLWGEQELHEVLQPPVWHDRLEVWAAGVTYRRSMGAREEESGQSGIYDRVYQADRPELFFKAPAWKVQGHGRPLRMRADSRWCTSEAEYTQVFSADQEPIGYLIGNDGSARDIEGDNPLYLPQAKVYHESCALGPGLVVSDEPAPSETTIRIEVQRGEDTVFSGETVLSELNRSVVDLGSWLFRESSFPWGAYLLTGTGVVPPGGPEDLKNADELSPEQFFTHEDGDLVRIEMAGLTLANRIVKGAS